MKKEILVQGRKKSGNAGALLITNMEMVKIVAANIQCHMNNQVHLLFKAGAGAREGDGLRTISMMRRYGGHCLSSCL